MSKREIGPLVGWKARVDGFDDIAVCADTKPSARYQVFKGAQDAGYTSVTFDRIQISRYSDLDKWATRQPKPRTMGLEYALREAP